MKKYIIALVLGLALVLVLATGVLADNGPHGSFTATTDACASCHRAHTAKYGSNALTILDPEALCLSCHGGLGAATDVEMGVYILAESPYGNEEGVDGGSLLGGGFDHALMATTWSGKVSADPAFNAVSRPVTSAHTLGTAGTLWGAGANNSTETNYVLECTSCHDPHGNAGYNPAATTSTRIASYRLLRWSPQGSDAFTEPTESVNWSGGDFPNNCTGATGCSTEGWLVPDNYAGDGNEWYTIGTTGAFAVGDYQAPSNTGNVYKPDGKDYTSAAVNMAYFCAQCHDRYFNNSRLRNSTDASVYCGEPGSAYANLPDYPPDPVTGLHPVDPTYCTGPGLASSPYNTAPVWGDNRPSGDDVYMYRHSSGDIRASMDGTVTAGAGTSISRSCMACHVAHGTAAEMTELAAGASLAEDSALLRMDNRTTCLRCHASTVGFTVGP